MARRLSMGLHIDGVSLHMLTSGGQDMRRRRYALREHHLTTRVLRFAGKYTGWGAISSDVNRITSQGAG